MTVQIGRPAGPQRVVARRGADRLSSRERAVIEDVAVFAVVASIAWHFVGVTAVLLGLVAVTAVAVSRVAAAQLPGRLVPPVLGALGVLGVIAGTGAVPLGSAWLAVAGWAVVASTARQLAVR